MAKQIRAALIAFTLLSAITGVIYPLAVTLIGQAVFPAQANGSLVQRDGQIVGSSLIGQTTADPAYFWWRPSVVNAIQGGSLTASGASNAGWTNAAWAQTVTERAIVLRAAHAMGNDVPIPVDLLFASASGIDPHISPEAAALQVERVAAVRGLEAAQVQTLVSQFTEPPQFGILGEARVNVLLLNLALDDLE